MKKMIMIFLGFLTFSSVFSQSWQWANCIHGNPPQFIDDVAIDKDGNVYTAIFSYGSEIIFNDTVFEVRGDNDFFIAKYSPAGEELWVKQFGGYWDMFQSQEWLHERVRHIVYDSVSNCLYVHGVFVEQCNFGNNIVLSTWWDDEQLFLAKFDLDGNCLWAKEIGSVYNDYPGLIVVDPHGNVFLYGVLFAQGYFVNIGVTAGGHMAKFDSDGNCLWVKKIADIFQSGSNFTIHVGLHHAVFLDDFLFVNMTHSSATFTVDTLTVSSPDYNGQMLAKFDTLCNIQWIRQFGGPVRGGASADMTIDASGGIYQAGSFKNNFATFGQDTLFSSAEQAPYLVKSDFNGNIIWAKVFRVSQMAVVKSLFFGYDHVYLTGQFQGTMILGDDTLTSEAEDDFYVYNLDENGTSLGAFHHPMAESTQILADQNGSIYIGAYFMDEVLFGDTTFFGNGWGEAIIAKHDRVASYVGLPEMETHNLIFYPNPNQGDFRVNIPESLRDNEMLTLKIYDISGRLVMENSVQSGQIQAYVSLPTGNRGIFYAILENKKTRSIGKIIVQ